ncbi:MAG: DNA repair protein RadC [Gammaproteobacteria bacterium]|jgi:DNA repair protein RadC
MTIPSWPRSERPREKLCALGADALSNAELLACLFRTGVRGSTAVELGQRLIAHFGGLRGVMDAEPGAVMQVSGIGLAKSVQLRAARSLAERYLAEPLGHAATVSDQAAATEFVRLRLSGRRQEVFACLFLNSQHGVIAFEELFFGTIDGANVHPREVVRRALERNAAAVILVHNHPSGVAEPSDADVRVTRRLADALALFDVRVLDHLVVGAEEVVSLAARGLL